MFVENFFAIDGCNTRGVTALQPVCMPRAALDRLAAVRCCSDTVPVTCEVSLCIQLSVTSFFLHLFNTVPPHSLKHNSQRLNRRNRRSVLVTNWSKELILIKVCRDEVRDVRAIVFLVHICRMVYLRRSIVFLQKERSIEKLSSFLFLKTYAEKLSDFQLRRVCFTKSLKLCACFS